MEGHEAMGLRYVGLPYEEFMYAVCKVEIGEQHFPHMGHVVEREPGDLVMVNHAVKGVRAGAVVGHHAKVGRVGFGNGVGRHGVHSGEEVTPKRGREMIFLNLNISLLADECRLVGIGGGWPRSIERGWVTILERVCPRPEAFSKAGTDRVDEGRVWVVRKKLFEAIDVDRGYDSEEGGIFGDGLESDRVKGLRERRTREGRSRF